MPDATCSVSECSTTGRLKVGLCGKHYQRWAKYGSTDLPPREYRSCVGPECTRRAGTSGLCRSHYKQWHLGKPLTPLKTSTRALGRPAICPVPGCGRPHKARGLCKTHSEHMEKYGELRAVQTRNPGQPCRLPGCTETAIARRMCSQHLARQYLPLRYGISADDYEGLLVRQGGACAICHGTNANGYALSVDHDHGCCPGNRSCGRCVRGLLCSRCNFAVGHMGDDPIRLRAAADYLERSG